MFRELALKSPSNPNGLYRVLAKRSIASSAAAQRTHAPTTPPVILKSQFKSALAEAGIDIDNNVYLGSLFNAFDRNETGNIDFRYA